MKNLYSAWREAETARKQPRCYAPGWGALLAAVFWLTVAYLFSGCGKPRYQSPIADQPIAVVSLVTGRSGLFVLRDSERGVVCYALVGAAEGLSCVPEVQTVRIKLGE